MRVLATIEGDDLPIDPGVMEHPEHAAMMGLVPGLDAEGVFDASWDPQERYKPCDKGWIGEDQKGVWLRRHPTTVLMAYPKLWAIVDEFRYGGQEIQPGEYQTRSAYEMEARIVMAMAYSRKLKRPTEGDN